MSAIKDQTDFVKFNDTMVNMNMVTHVKFLDGGTQDKPKPLALLYHGETRLITVDRLDFLQAVSYR